MSKEDKIILDIINLLGTYSFEKKIHILQSTMQKLAIEKNINPSKLTNGTINENVLCLKLGLTWNNKKIHGCDAFDKKGRACEIKTFKYLNTTKLVNVMYYFPKHNGESFSDYLKKVKEKYSVNKGGHYWGAISGKSKLVNYWFIECDKFVEFLEQILNKRKSNKENLDKVFNFGGNICKHCKGIHKLDIIESNAKNNQSYPFKIVNICKKK